MPAPSTMSPLRTTCARSSLTGTVTIGASRRVGSISALLPVAADDLVLGGELDDVARDELALRAGVERHAPTVAAAERILLRPPVPRGIDRLQRDLDLLVVLPRDRNAL